MDVYQLIRQAILGRKIVVATYKGHVRVMCPHVIGRKNGKEHAFFYQFAGGSERGLGPDGSNENWRCIDISLLSNVSVREGAWHTCRSGTDKQACIDQVDVAC